MWRAICLSSPEFGDLVTRPIPYTKPSITELEVTYATDAAQNGWGPHCYDYIEGTDARVGDILTCCTDSFQFFC